MKNFIKHNYFKYKETFHNFLWQSLQIFGKQGTTFLIFFLAAKLLSPYEFGVYNYVLVIVFFLIIFGDFGISKATTKYVAEYNVTDNDKLKAVLFNSGLIIFCLAALISIIVLVFGQWYFQDKYLYILYLLPLIFIAPFTSLYDGIYSGLKKFKQLAIISLSTSLIGMIVAYFLIKAFGLIGALIGQNLFYLILIVFLGLGYREFNLKINKAVIREIGKYSMYFGLASLGYFLYTRVDIIVLGHFGYIEEIGYYEIINKIFLFILLPVNILSTVIAPDSTKNFVLQRFVYIKNKIIKESLIMFIVGLLVALASYLIFPVIFRIFLQEYDNVLLIKLLNILLILIPLRFFSTYISAGYIAPSGNIKILTKYLIIFGVVNFILNIVLINLIGFIGVIYATLISQILFIIFKDFVSFIPLIFRYAKQ